MNYIRIYFALLGLIFSIDNSVFTQVSFGIHTAPWSGEDKGLYNQGFGGNLGIDTKSEDGLLLHKPLDSIAFSGGHL